MQHQPPGIRKRPFIDAIAIGVCNYLKEKKVTPKEFLFAYLASDDIELKENRRYWGVERGFQSTLVIINEIKSLTLKANGGKQQWKDFVLLEVDTRSLKRGYLRRLIYVKYTSGARMYQG